MLKIYSVNSISQLWVMSRSQSSIYTDIYKQIVSILSCPSDSVQGRRDSYFRAKTLYLSLRTSEGVNNRQICCSKSHEHIL